MKVTLVETVRLGRLTQHPVGAGHTGEGLKGIGETFFGT